MKKRSFRYVYGPVSSWRLGSSLGVDPVSGGNKICNFDCVYCQLGRTREFANERRKFIPVKDVIEEINSISSAGSIDYITLSGAGEPTLASNLGDMIQAIKKIRNEKIAVITNSSLLDRKDVREDLLAADFVLAKLDACSSDSFQQMNRPVPGIDFEKIADSLKRFRFLYKNRMALQVMFTRINQRNAEQIAQLVNEICPDEIQINTPLRRCLTRALPRIDLEMIEKCFRNVCGDKPVISNVYNAKRKKVASVSEPDTLRRRGKDCTKH